MSKPIIVIAVLILAIAPHRARAISAADAPASAGPARDFGGFERQLVPYLRLYHDPAFRFDEHDLRGRFSYQRGGGCDLIAACRAPAGRRPGF